LAGLGEAQVVAVAPGGAQLTDTLAMSVAGLGAERFDLGGEFGQDLLAVPALPLGFLRVVADHVAPPPFPVGALLRAIRQFLTVPSASASKTPPPLPPVELPRIWHLSTTVPAATPLAT
jgi:hypothetical protein